MEVNFFSWQLAEMEQAGPATVRTAEVGICLPLSCWDHVPFRAIGCPHFWGQEWCSDDNRRWLLWHRRIKRRAREPHCISQTVTIFTPFSFFLVWQWVSDGLFYGCHRWEKHTEIEYCSEHVEIVFSAIYNLVNQLGVEASLVQGRDITGHLVEIVSLDHSYRTWSFAGNLL